MLKLILSILKCNFNKMSVSRVCMGSFVVLSIVLSLGVDSDRDNHSAPAIRSL